MESQMASSTAQRTSSGISAQSGSLNVHASLRIGVLCTSTAVNSWQRKAVELILAEGVDRLVGVMVMSRTHEGNAQKAPLFSASAPQFYCFGEDLDHGVCHLDESGVAVILGWDLDVLLVFGIERIQAELAASPKHGAWCFPGFGARCDEKSGVVARPVRDGNALTELMMIRLGSTPGLDVVLRRGQLRTLSTALKNFETAARVMAQWPAALVAMLKSGGDLPTLPLRAEDWVDFIQPVATQNDSKIVSAIRNIGRKVVNLFHYEQWHVGIVPTSLSSIVQDGLRSPISWATARPGFGGFYADPMGLEVEENLKVYCEYYNYWTGKGDIRVLRYDQNDGWLPDVERCISEPFHLSYPYIFNLSGACVCMPESCEAGAAFVYPMRADGSIDTAMRRVFLDFEIADPTLLEHEGYWYLFGARANEAQYTLRIWYARSLEGPWTAHPANPVKVDVQSARPAGPIVKEDGKIYRPVQDSTKSYGSAARIMEIVELSPVEFNEVCVRTIEPDKNWPYPDGIHTLTQTRHGVLIDAKVIRCSIFAPVLRIANLVGVLWQRRRIDKKFGK